MHDTTALYILSGLVRQDLLDTTMTTFRVPRYPQPVHLRDVKECFVALADKCGHDKVDMRFTYNFGIEVWCREKLYEKLFKLLYVNQKIFPLQRDEGGRPGAGGPLPTLFVSHEKTQVRQVPLVEDPPWPFHFLMELGGMLVIRPRNKRDALLELRQYVNNHPQFRLKLDVKEWPDGSMAIFTYWFEHVPRLEKKENLNVPG